MHPLPSPCPLVFTLHLERALSLLCSLLAILTRSSMGSRLPGWTQGPSISSSGSHRCVAPVEYPVALRETVLLLLSLSWI